MKYFTEEAVRSAINVASIENVADANHNYAKGFRDAMKAVEEMPESIVRCKDCSHFIDHRCRHVRSIDDWRSEKDFCSFAKRKA